MAADSFEATEQTMRTPGGALDDRLLEEEYLKAEKFIVVAMLKTYLIPAAAVPNKGLFRP